MRNASAAGVKGQKTVERLAARGKLTKVKIGGSVRFRSSDLHKLIETGGTS